MSVIRLMDSSIRDGGNVNDWNFGKAVIDGIVSNLSRAGVDIIELGYLKNIKYDKNKSLYNYVSEAKNNIPVNRGNEEYSLMVQEDKWEWSNLEECDGTIKHIRVSFHKNDIDEGLELCRLVKNKGYVLHCNPINIMGYTDDELLELLKRIDEVGVNVFTIVDTFGSMSIRDMQRISALVDNNLSSTVRVSAHLHENLGQAFALAQVFIDFFESRRDIYIDASLYGIGRIPGNLCLELIMRYLIDERHADYNINYIYDAIDDFIENIKKLNPWGYSLPYALSATYNLHRTYPEYLFNKSRLKTKDIRKILEDIVPEERVIYNQRYIEELYERYVNVEYDDEDTLKSLRKDIYGRNIMILAPGKSLFGMESKVRKLVKRENCVVISIHFLCDDIKSEFVFFTNAKKYGYLKGRIEGEKVIATSNLLRGEVNAEYIINYGHVNVLKDYCIEDSVISLLMLLEKCNCSDIWIAGFDGFIDSESYGGDAIGVDFINSGVDNYREKVKSILEENFKELKVTFVTPSIYCEEKEL